MLINNEDLIKPTRQRKHQFKPPNQRYLANENLTVNTRKQTTTQNHIITEKLKKIEIKSI